MRFVDKTRRPMPAPTTVGLKTRTTHESVAVHRNDRNRLNELNRTVRHGRATPSLGDLINSCTPMKHNRYPPTHVYNDARGLGRQMLDHDPNRTTNIRLLGIFVMLLAGMLVAGSATLGVRRSLSSVDNIGCLDHRFSDYRFGGIRLENGEQATSLAPTTLNQPSQKATIFSKHFIFICI